MTISADEPLDANTIRNTKMIYRQVATKGIRRRSAAIYTEEYKGNEVKVNHDNRTS